MSGSDGGMQDVAYSGRTPHSLGNTVLMSPVTNSSASESISVGPPFTITIRAPASFARGTQ
jgi:hypothetical protein